ncbi:lipoyl-[acyl-carrier protein]-protein-n-lipoyltransferase [Alcanivorax hongdengensis A-11-3]|uniref:Octanoyltransferase n=1 Tax=Alcanivorax hongdengensis A-11-3 TaxID=1177179 RepID=L0WIX3_9GAMM|nr:lipoyl(octanoyl) transferase LipB [Alcanivorax hongdengensis]EKF75795.1 lipoyl-[acyl-carrier protein]-protein-n-lipoyltransferase [Alcanivorax hongdengensis A-11-3]
MDTLVRYFPTVDYPTCWQAMRDFTDRRDDNRTDELWVLEHPPVFTLGQAGKPEHVLNAGNIPVVQSDRGGQVTYHGPGQTVIYLMLDIRRLGLGSRGLVNAIEAGIIDFLASQGIQARNRDDAPGVYVDGAKIASLGLRIRRGASYHGLAINRDMDLAPWQRINPCGHVGQPMTTLQAQGVHLSRDDMEHQLVALLAKRLGLTPRTAPPPGWYNGDTDTSLPATVTDTP